MIRCWARPFCQDVSSATSVLRYDEESGCRCVDVKLIVRPLKSNVMSSADRPPSSSRGPLATIGKRDRTMLPIPLVAPESVSNFQYQVCPVYCFISAAIVTGSSVFLLQLVLRSISFRETTSGLNLAIHLTRR